MKKFYIKSNSKGLDAVLEMYSDNEYILLKNSKISHNVSNKFKGKTMVEKRRKEFSKDFIVLENIKFSSPSTAGEFVFGTSCNGKEKWKDKNKVSIAEYLRSLNNE